MKSFFMKDFFISSIYLYTMITDLKIRPITQKDAAAVLEIYRPYIETTAITFEYTVPKLSDWEKRIETYTQEYPWLVALWNQKIVGYAYASKHRDRIAYSWDAEVSVYVEETFQKKGIAQILYRKLFEILKFQGIINVYAIITSPNPKSEGFHESFGFYDVGRFHKSGYKFEEWFDTRWMQMHLSKHPFNPTEILSFSSIKDSNEIQEILGSLA
jgi:L-amino acid N-acyltransferase YncA